MQNGSICVEEFVCGLAIVLHGTFKERCSLLFSVFNLGNDEGISKEELRTMLTAILQSTNTILYTVGITDSAVLGSLDMQESIATMVDTAFKTCDISRTGKLLPMVCVLLFLSLSSPPPPPPLVILKLMITRRGGKVLILT